MLVVRFGTGTHNELDYVLICAPVPSASCVPMAWRWQLCSRCSNQSSSRGSPTPFRRAGALRRLLTDSVSRPSCDLRRAVRADLWPSAPTSDPPTFGDLCSSADDELLNKIVTNSNPILHELLPPPSNASQHYSLRQRAHSLQLPAQPTHLSDCNFITRMYKKLLLALVILFPLYCLSTWLYWLAFCHAIL